MSLSLGLEKLYVVIHWLRGAACSNSGAWRKCMSHFLSPSYPMPKRNNCISKTMFVGVGVDFLAFTFLVRRSAPCLSSPVLIVTTQTTARKSQPRWACGAYGPPAGGPPRNSLRRRRPWARGNSSTLAHGRP